MMMRDEALFGADADVLWLRSRAEVQAERSQRVRTALRRAACAITAGAILTGSMPTQAADSQAADDAVAREIDAALAPVPVATVDLSNVRIAPKVPASPQVLERDLQRYLDERIDGTAAGRDPKEVLTFGAMKVERWVVDAVVRASETVGVDPVYMMALADKESSFATSVKAGTSSAEGLFQFIQGTWLDMVRLYGPKHGLAQEASLIQRKGGSLEIADQAERDRVMALRRDPFVAALMAAEMLKRDRKKIETALGRDLTHAECYIAHFLGVDSAKKLMKLAGDKPKQSASKVFPKAAKANKAIFYAREGKKARQLTVFEVKTKLDAMMVPRLVRYTRVTAWRTAPATDWAARGVN